MRIGITYNLKDDLSPQAIINDESCEEFDRVHTIDAICEVFAKNGHEPVKLGCAFDLIERIKKDNVEFVFNIAEGYSGRNRESHVPSILEMAGIPYSGSDALTLGMTLDKIVTKKIAFHAGVPVAAHAVIEKIEDVDMADKKLKYPLITKPAWEGSSKGVYLSSRVFERKELERSVKTLLDKYKGQPILAEEYIEGREITVGVIGNASPDVLGIMEVINKRSPGEDFFYSIEVKRDWENLVDYIMPDEKNSLLGKHLRHYAIRAFKEFNCRDIARVDFRVSRDNKIFMLELNPLPGLSPEYADLVIMSRKIGLKYDDLVMLILNNALSRQGLAKNITGKVKL